ncbi:MAG: MFS transporter [Dehalococcoidia bacterium]|nr:MFS transporter [Dehalococcoidia bacterium]
MASSNGMPPHGVIVRKKKPLIFYGWWIVIAAVILNILQGGILFYGFTLVLDPVTDEMGWTKTELTIAYPIMGVVIGVISPFLGGLFDRIGPRPLIGAGMVIVAASMIMLHYVQSLPMFYLWFSLLNLGSMGIWLSVGPTVANWFVRARGRALGTYSLGFALAGLLAPPLYWLIDGGIILGFEFDGLGWRDAFFLLGVMFLFLMPLTILIFRHRPENMGLYPDGADYPPLEVSPGAEMSDDAEMTTTAMQALRTQAFWLMAICSALTFLTIATLTVHWVPYMGSIGIEREAAAFFLPLLPLGTMVGRLLFGVLADLYDKRRVTALAFCVQAAAVLMLSQIDPAREWTLVLFLVLWGFGFGGTIVARMALQGYLFGRNSFGALQGMLTMTTEAGFALSPLIASIVFEELGTYRPLFLGFAVLAFLAGPLTMLIRRPTPQFATGFATAQSADKDPAPAPRPR